jgi:hypothetical protein
MALASPTTVPGMSRSSCVSLAAMCSRRQRAFSACQSRRTTASPSPCLDTLRTSARAHEDAARARASQSFAQPLRGTPPIGPSQWAWPAPFGSPGYGHHTAHEKQAHEPGKAGSASRSGPAAQESLLGCPLLQPLTNQTNIRPTPSDWEACLARISHTAD